MKKILIICLIMFGFILMCIGFSNQNDKESPTTETTTLSQETEGVEQNFIVPETSDATDAKQDTITVTTPTVTLTLGQKNAIKKAESYLNVMHFSKQGLINQLEFEKFSTEDAVFAVEYIVVDWNEQAAGKAKDYLKTMAFSADGLRSQLDFEGFTSEEIEYAIAAVGY